MRIKYTSKGFLFKYQDLILVNLLIIGFSLLQSCEKLEDNRRILLKGQISNPEILSQNNVKVFATFDHSLDFDFDNENILGQSSINPDGSFNFIIPAPVNDEIYLQVNPEREEESLNTNAISSLSLIISAPIIKARELIEIEEFQLRERATINLNFNYVSPETSTIDWQLTYADTNCITYLDLLSESSIADLCNFGIVTSGQVQNEDQTLTFNSLSDTDALLSFTINDGTQQTITILLDSIENDFEIEY